MKIQLLENYKENKKGDFIECTRNEAHGLIEKGLAKIDYQNKQIDYGTSKLVRTKSVFRDSRKRKGRTFEYFNRASKRSGRRKAK